MSITIFLIPLLSLLLPTSHAQLPGTWELLLPDAGIASMHTAVTHKDTVVLLDRTNIGPSKILLPHHKCQPDPNPNPNPKNRVSEKDCTAHSVLFDPQSNQIRPLTILTDTWCSSAQFLPDGTLLQTGGDLDGLRKIRKFSPCDPSESCDWDELSHIELSEPRWYSTNQILPNGTIIIVGGRATSTIEFYPPTRNGAIQFPFLSETADRQGDNLYPYVHLLPDGNLFIFSNNKAVLYDYQIDAIVRNYPQLEGGPRNYPSAGSSAMMALEGDFSEAVIVVCGGAEYGAFIKMDTSSPAHGSCGRIMATEPDPVWEMEEMPFNRVMGDMVMLPTGEVLIINGAMSGSQGFELGSNPVLNPVLYRPDQPAGLRFMVLNPGVVPRMYHSTANLLPDGRVLLAGSNPHYFYRFEGEFPTELRLEAFSPEYLGVDRANLRPVVVDGPGVLRYGERFEVRVRVELPLVGPVEVNLGSAPFATHSFSQGQRLVKLGAVPGVPDGEGYRVSVVAPPNGRVAPPGYYMMFAVNQGVPSVARWVQLVV